MYMARLLLTRFSVLLLVAGAVLAACAPSSTGNPSTTNPSTGNSPATAPTSAIPTTGAIVAPTTAAPAQAPAVPPAANEQTTISVARSDAFDHFLTDGKGRTLYVFMKDGNNVSNCNDSCAKTWPPLTVTGQPTAMQGLDDTFLGTIKRADGTTQVTYNGHPLYYFGGDQGKGDTKGQGIGGNWFVVSLNGDPVKGDSSSGGSPASPTSAAPANPTRSY